MHFNKYLENERCVILDAELSDHPSPAKDDVIKTIKDRYFKLEVIKKELEKIL